MGRLEVLKFWRWRPRFSLATLLLFSLLVGSSATLGFHWEPWALVRVLTGHTKPVISTSFSPDGKSIVSASYDYTARVWDAQSGAERAVLKGHTSYVFSASFSPDGKSIVAASEDGTARVWVRRRPDYALGVAALIEFWTTLLLAGAFGWSVRADWARFRRLAAERKQSPAAAPV